MIEALIRDEKRLICVITIQLAPDKDSLNVDIFIPGEGKTLSGVMPAGGSAPQQVARAIMTVFPVSALPKSEPDLRPASQILKENAIPLSPEMVESEKSAYQVAREKRRQEMIEREDRLHETGPAPMDGSPETLESPLEGEPLSPEIIEQARHAQQRAEEVWDTLDRRIEKLSKESFPEQWALVSRRMASLDKREVEFIEREKKLGQDIPVRPGGDRENFRKSQPEERR